MGVVLIGFFILFLTGAFEENKTKPQNLSFVIGSLADDDTRFDLKTSGPFDLKLTTTTENVAASVITLTVDKLGIIEIPNTVALDQTFVIWPVNNGGNNVGGKVEISASCGAAFAKCSVFVDVKSITIIPIVSGEVFDEDKDCYVVEKDDLISFGYTTTPNSAANPGLLADGSSNSPQGKEKEVIFALYEANGYNYLESDVATFATVTGTPIGSCFSTTTYSPNNVRIRINSLESKIFYLKAYTFETYQLQEENASNTIDAKIQNMVGYVVPLGETVADDPNRVKFIIGDVVIEGIQTADVPLSVYMNEPFRIYLKNTVGTSPNLDITFSSNLTNVGDDYFNYLLNNLEFEGTGLSVNFQRASNPIDSYIEVTTNAGAYTNNILNPSILTIKYKRSSSPDEWVTKNVSIANSIRKYNPTITYKEDDGAINIGNNAFQMENFFEQDNSEAVISSTVTNPTFYAMRYYLETSSAEASGAVIVKVIKNNITSFIVVEEGSFTFDGKEYDCSGTVISGGGVPSNDNGSYTDNDISFQVVSSTYKAIKITLTGGYCYLVVNANGYDNFKGSISFGTDSEICFAKDDTAVAEVSIRGRVVVYDNGYIMNASTEDYTWVEDDNVLISFSVTNS